MLCLLQGTAVTLSSCYYIMYMIAFDVHIAYKDLDFNI